MGKFLLFLKKLQRNEHGSVFVLVAISLVALVGFSAMVIDGGRLFYQKNHLQKAVDAAVLAAAPYVLYESESKIEEIVNQFIQDNGVKDYTLTNVDIAADKSSLFVKAKSNVPFTFAKVLSFSDADVPAKAKVELTTLSGYQGQGIIPLGINLKKYKEFKKGELLTLKFEDFEEDEPGWYGALLFEPAEDAGGGADQFRAAIRSGSKEEIKIGDILEVKDGVNHGPTVQGFDDLFGSCDTFAQPVNSAEDVYQFLDSNENPDCNKRLVVVPIYEPHTYNNQNQQKKVVDVKITGFATMFITKVVQQGGKATVHGIFLNYAVSGGGSSSPPNYGAYTFRLVE